MAQNHLCHPEFISGS